MKLIRSFIAVLVTILGLSGCGAILDPNIVPEQLKSCLETSHSDYTGLTFGFDHIAWKNKISSFDIGNISGPQKQMLEQQFASTPQDSFLVLEGFIRNNSNRPKMWNPRHPPLFQLVDTTGVTYNSLGNTTGMHDSLSSKIALGYQNINPNRELRGNVIFDVPTSGTYVLMVYKGLSSGGWSYYRGREIMRCNVPK